MNESRRFFMKSFSVGAAALATADGLVAKAGGDLNVNAVRTSEIDSAREKLARHFTVEPALSTYVEVRDHSLYDVMRVPAGIEVPDRFPFLSSPVGHNLPGSWSFKSFVDTNLVRANQLPPPNEFYIQRILFLLSDAMDKADRDQLAMSYYFEVQLMDKIVARAPLARCPVTGTIESLVDFRREDGFTPRAFRRNVVIDSPYCLHLERPIHIPSMCHFAFNLYGRPFEARSNVEMYAVLDGIGIFAVQ